MLLKLLEIIRIVSVTAVFFFGYQMDDPVAQLHLMIPIIIVAIAGISGLEGLFFAKTSAELKGFEVGSNYQRQSAIALSSYAVTAIMVYIANWGIQAELTILFVFIFFFFFSAVNHGVDAIRRKNYKWQNINRPFLTLFLIVGLIYPVIKALQSF
ncbi:hypothetical protein KKA17_06480 [bacterium]|nr:hypothetical protein [bacterium]MBU1883606.1 hypothetical protein [bacterium]